MTTTKVSVNVEWLSACGGCDTSLVDLHEKILQLFDAVQIQHWPLITDIKERPKAKIGLISGAVRSQHDHKVAVEMRERCDAIVAFGTCAVYGGISAASLAHSNAEILDRVYVHNPTTVGGAAPKNTVAVLEDKVLPLDEVIPVDLYLPGCPPHANFTFEALAAVIAGRVPKARDESVCGRCKRTMKKTEVAAIDSGYAHPMDPSLCFLSQGQICLGSVTLDRCLSPCTEVGAACTGCAGPTMQILTEPNRDLRTEVAERMSLLTKIPAAKVVETMEAGAKSHYAYAMATKMVGSKPTFLIKKWIEKIEATT
ncbi:MAG: methyl viologen-reducing hydrogenase [Deltaproteobacteria bacterium]|nr:methyl viologen-reducing hydrogenase [Deltaproteobacteria bacterium]